jgi:hypothetical protein
VLDSRFRELAALLRITDVLYDAVRAFVARLLRRANFSPSYVAPILAGAIAALAVIGYSMIRPARRDVGRHDDGPGV